MTPDAILPEVERRLVAGGVDLRTRMLVDSAIRCAWPVQRVRVPSTAATLRRYAKIAARAAKAGR